MFRPVPDFSEDALIQMVPDGRDGIWALASCTLGSCWRLWHFSNGQWQGPYQPRISGTATSVTDLAQVPGTTSLWGAGGRTVGSRQQGMILLQGGWPGTVKPAPAHKKAAAARRYSPVGPARRTAQPVPGQVTRPSGQVTRPSGQVTRPSGQVTGQWPGTGRAR